MAKRIGLSDYYLDVAGTDDCPCCGAKLIPVSYYGGKLVDVRNFKEQGLLMDGVRTTKTYGNFVQLWGGYCAECARMNHNRERKSNEGIRSARKWFLIFLTTAVVSLACVLICDRLGRDTLAQVFAVPCSIAVTGLIPAAILYLVRGIRRKADREFRIPTDRKRSAALVDWINSTSYGSLAARQATGMDVFCTPDAMKNR